MNSSVSIGLFIKNAVSVQTSQLNALNDIHLSLFKELVNSLQPGKSAEKDANEMPHILRLKPAGAKSPYLHMKDHQVDLRVKTDAEAIESAVIFSDFSDESLGRSAPFVPFVADSSVVKPVSKKSTTESIDFPDHRSLDISLPAFRTETILAENVYRDQENKPSKEFKSQTLFIQILDEYNALFSEFAKIFSAPPANIRQLQVIFEAKKKIFEYRMMFNQHHTEKKMEIKKAPAVNEEAKKQLLLFQARYKISNGPTDEPDMTEESTGSLPDPYAYPTITISKTHNVNLSLLEEYYMTRASDPNPFFGATGVDRNTKLNLALLCIDCYIKEGKVSEVLKAQANRGAGFGNKLGNRLAEIDKNLANPLPEDKVNAGVGTKNWFL